MTDGDRLAELLGEWRELAGRGEEITPEAFAARHPELEAELLEHLATVELLESAFSAPAEPALERIGEYRILREIGRGGMGVVYKAEQDSMRRRVALKVLFPSVTASKNAVKRFQREARAAGRLKHTNIVSVHQLGQDKGVWYCAMELVAGRPLGEVLAEAAPAAATPESTSASWRRVGEVLTASTVEESRRERSGPRSSYRRVARKFAELAEALQEAHDRGVIHRDLKPSNVLLDDQGRLRLLDFGLARLEEPDSRMTMTGDVVGTPLYMSPEQLRGDPDKLDVRTDVYSLGATLYEALTLAPPFPGSNLAEISRRILKTDAPPPRRLNPGIPKDLETIVLKTLEKEPDKRYASAEALAADLRRFADDLQIGARRASLAERAWRKVKRHRVRSALAAALVLALAFAGIYAVRESRGRERRAVLEARERTKEYVRLIERAGSRIFVVEDASSPAPHEETALELYDRAIELLPDRPEAWFGRALCRGRDLEKEDLPDLEEARARGLPRRVYHLARATILRHLGDETQSELEREIAEDFEDPSPESRYFEACLAAQRGRYEAAETLLTGVVRDASPASPFHLRALLMRAQVRRALRNWQGALADFHRTGDDSPANRVRIACLWRRIHGKASAQERFDRVLESGGLEEESWSEVFRPLYASGDLDWLREAGRRALAAHPDSRDLRVRLAPYLHTNPEDRSWAVRLYRQVLEDRPDNVEARIGLAWSLLRIGHHQEAEAEARKARDADPDNGEAAAVLAHVLIDQERPEEAMPYVEEALARYRRTSLAWHLKGLVMEQMQRYEEAEDAYGQALRLSPGDRQARWDLLSLRATLNVPPTELLPEVEALVRDHPRYAQALSLRAWLQLTLGRTDEALRSADEALAIDGGLISTRLTRAAALLGLDRGDEAYSEAMKARELGLHHVQQRSRFAAVLLSCGKLEEASEVLDGLLEESPSDVWLRVLQTRCDRLAEREDLALERLREVVRDAPDLPFALRELGATLLFADCPEEATPLLQRACEALPDDPKLRAWLAQALVQTQEFEAGERVLAEARERLGETPELANAEGILRQLRGQLEAAAAAYRRAVALRPGSAPYRFNLAQTLFHLERWSELDPACTALLALRPDDADGRDWRARARFALNEYAKAEQDLAWIRREHPERTDLLSIHAETLLWLGRFAEARRVGEEAIRADPDDWVRHALLSMILRKLAIPREALEHARTACELESEHWIPHSEIGFALLALGKSDEALPALARAIELSALLADVYQHHGAILAHQGRFREAADSFAQGIERDPESAHLWYNLASCRSRLNEPEKALAALDKAVELDPTLAGVAALRVVPFYSLQRYEEAAQAATQALLSMPNDPGLRFYRAMSYLNTYRPQEALEDANRFLELVSRGAPNRWMGHLARSYARLRLGQDDEAIREAAVLRKLGFEVEASMIRGFVHQHREEFAAARDCFEAATEKAQSTWPAQHLAQFYASCVDPEIRDLERARTLAKWVASREPEATTTRLVLGIVQYHSARYDEARANLLAAADAPSLGSRAAAWLYLAMTNHQLEHPDEAQSWLAKARKLIAEKGIDDPEIDRIEREAAALIGPD